MLDPSRAANIIASALTAIPDKTNAVAVWTAVCTAIFTEIKTNGQINSIPLQNITVSPPSSVTSQGTTQSGTGFIQ